MMSAKICIYVYVQQQKPLPIFGFMQISTGAEKISFPMQKIKIVNELQQT